MVIRSTVSGFVDFIRERGVAGFAIGFVLGGAAQNLVKAFMDDLVNPLLSLFLAPVQDIRDFSIHGFKVGDFASVLLNFVVLLFVVYAVFRILRLEKLDKPKQ